ncbi:DUF4097 family beta strand repeat-containing protein [Thalassotalea fusca]
MRDLLTYSTVLLSLMAFSTVAFESVDKKLAASGVNHVIIENQRGNVSIKGGDYSSVSVSGELDKKAEGFTFEKDGSTIFIKVEMPNHYRSSWSDNDGSDLQIVLPEKLKVSFNGVSSDVEIGNIASGAEIKTVSGNIDAQNLKEHVELNSISGDISTKKLRGKLFISTVSGEIKDRESSGRLSMQAVSGDIDSKSEATEVSIETVSGEIELTLGEVEDIEISTVSGEAEVSLTLAKNGMMKMSSVSGDLDAVFNGDVSANFKLKTNAGGDIKNKITSDKPERGKYVRNAKLSFDTGDASGTVRATTVSGTISVAQR